MLKVAIFYLVMFLPIIFRRKQLVLVLEAHDGDTYYVLNLATLKVSKVRLANVDFLETDQKHADVLTEIMMKRLSGVVIEMKVVGEYKYGGDVVEFWDGPTCINDWAITEGLANAYMATARHRELEEAARRKGRGIHSLRYIKPWEWRKAKKHRAEEKGNV